MMGSEGAGDESRRGGGGGTTDPVITGRSGATGNAKGTNGLDELGILGKFGTLEVLSTGFDWTGGVWRSFADDGGIDDVVPAARDVVTIAVDADDTAAALERIWAPELLTFSSLWSSWMKHAISSGVAPLGNSRLSADSAWPSVAIS